MKLSEWILYTAQVLSQRVPGRLRLEGTSGCHPVRAACCSERQLEPLLQDHFQTARQYPLSCHWAPPERAWLGLLCSLPSGLFFVLMRFPLSLLVPRLNSPSSLSLSSEERCSSALMILTAICWALSSTCMSLLLGNPEAGAVLQLWHHQCQVEGKAHLPHLTPPDAAQDRVSVPCGKGTLLAPGQLGAHQDL